MSDGIDFDYFSPSHADIALYKKMIKQQGTLVCRDQIYVDIISKSLKKHSFGVLAKARKEGNYVPLSPLLQQRSDDEVLLIGRGDRRTAGSLEWLLLGFAMCEPYDEDMDTVILSLACARKDQKGLGADLIGIIEDQASQLGYKKVQIFALPEPPLIKYYERLGYKKAYVIPDYKTGANKLVSMTKRL